VTSDLISHIAPQRCMEPTKPHAPYLDGHNECGNTSAPMGNFAAYNRTPARPAITPPSTIHPQYLTHPPPRNLGDFSTRLSERFRCLRDHFDLRESVRISFQLIQVDEFQDTNRARTNRRR